jgi:hemerythrin-like domain-containing protein
VHRRQPYPAPRPPPTALAIIDGEHRSLEAVLKALRRYVGPLRHHRVKPDCEIFATILSYIETFADRFHHPKEDEYLFRALRDRTREADRVLLDLQHEHATGPAEFDALKRALVRTRGGGDWEVEEFACLLERYAAGQEDHLRKEDGIVIPLARRFLTPRDWEPIDHAFRANRDPFFGIGAQGPMGSLMRRAVAMA